MATSTRARLSILLLPVCLSLAPAVQAKPPGQHLALGIEPATPSMCLDTWHRAVPCRAYGDGAYPTSIVNRGWSDLWPVAGVVAANPRLLLGGKRVACGSAYHSSPLFKVDFTGFQLNMDIELDDEQERFDTIRLAYRSCWR